MGKDMFDTYPAAKDVFLRADKVLGFSVSQKCFSAPAEELKDTSLAQLAILAVSLANYEVFKTKNIKIDYCSGLSLGEYSCLYAAGVLSFEDLFLLVKERALAMQEAAQNSSSTMFAVLGMEKAALETFSRNEGFYISNINAPGQIVISLAKSDREKVKNALELAGAKVIEIEVSGGFHSRFMQPAAVRLQKVIDSLNFKDASLPLISNFTAKAHLKAVEIKSNLINQLTSTVRWLDCVNLMASSGVDTFYEIGPSKVLKGLIKKINPALKVVNIEKKADIDNLIS
jgi:[acyl-carrier-protein] S-malonyltransferase